MKNMPNFKTYEEFEEEFRKHHTCGIPFIPEELAYSSDCPQCCPIGSQWKEDCRDMWNKDKTEYRNGYWYNPVKEV